MDYIRLGKTDLLVSRTAFGAMRLEKSGSAENVAALVKRAYDAGINFFDTSRRTGKSEKLLGASLYTLRQNVIIATKSASHTYKKMCRDIDESLSAMHIDYIDLYQFETDTFLPEKESSDGVYSALVRARDEGKIKHIGITTQDVDTAFLAAKSGVWETVQVPFNALSSMETVELVKLCAANEVGFIAMQPLCGGLIRDSSLAFGYIYQYEYAVPVWGVRTIDELNDILSLNEMPPTVDEEFLMRVEKIRSFFN